MNDSDALVRRLAELDTCAVSDALDSLGLSGAVTGLRRLTTNRRVAGRVRTVKLGTQRPAGGALRHLCTGAIDAAGPGDVIVVEQRTGVDAGGWGGVLSTAAACRGLAGVIVDGPARDVDESEALGFAVFARGATARTARGRVYEQADDVPVRVGDVTVSPGDLVVADGTAVVFVPADRAGEVLAAAARIAAREALMVQGLREGRPAAQVMGADYESMLDGDRETPGEDASR